MPSLLSLLLGSVLAATPGQLLERHRPVVVLHPEERSAPTVVEGFLADAELVGGRYDMRACSTRDGLAALQCYDDADEPAPAVVYGMAFRRGGRIALQYWLFHAFEIWSPVVPQSLDYWRAHEGDWEALTILLDARGRPVEVGTSRHCGGARQAWAKVEKRRARPVVYSALGSHALYFRPGRYRQDEGCWPVQAVQAFKAAKLPILDHVSRGRALSPGLVRVTGTSPDWMRFRGSFGETQYFHFPEETLDFGSGPYGPAAHDLWRQPFATPARWKLG